MEPIDSTRRDAVGATIVRDPAAVTYVLDPERARFLQPFMRGERSTSQAAAEVGLSVKDMAYRVRRMLELGLLTIARVEPRTGRPIRYLRAAPAYFLPFADMPDADLVESVESLLRETRRQLVQGLVQALGETERDLHRWGWRLEPCAEERLSVRPSVGPDDERPLSRHLLDGASPAVYLADLMLWLNHADAKRLQRDLAELLTRYDGREGPDRYVVSIGLTPSKAS